MRTTRRAFLKLAGGGTIGGALSTTLPLGAGAALWRPPAARAGAGAEATRPFAAFVARGEIAPGRFAILSRFRVAAGSDGVDPVGEGAMVRLGTAEWRISPHAFQVDDRGVVTFQGRVGGTFLDLLIRPLHDGSLEFAAEGYGATLTGTTSPPLVSLTIGDDAGTTHVAGGILA